MELLQAGVDCSVIALWLGHELIETTQTYLHAHLALKEAALAKLKPYERGKRTRFQPQRPPARLPGGALSDQNYAEWNGAAAHATRQPASTTTRHSGTVRHSSAGGINRPMPRSA